MKEYLFPFLVGVALVCSILVSFLIGRERGYGEGYDAAMNEPHKPDTVEVEKPIYIEKPVPVVEWRDREKLVYVPVPVHDTTEIHDTLAIPREFKRYEDENYSAQVSGIDPMLDWIKINQKTKYITNTVVEKRRWGFGVTAGAGVLWDGKFHGGIGAVAGLQYNF